MLCRMYDFITRQSYFLNNENYENENIVCFRLGFIYVFKSNYAYLSFDINVLYLVVNIDFATIYKGHLCT